MKLDQKMAEEVYQKWNSQSRQVRGWSSPCVHIEITGGNEAHVYYSVRPHMLEWNGDCIPFTIKLVDGEYVTSSW